MTDTIGERVAAVRRRRGLSQSVVAGLAGISKSYLSRLESGEREFNRRGLVENLADALGCSPMDLTGGPNIRPDKRSLIASSAVPGVTAALHDTTLDDVPDGPTRPVAELAAAARAALLATDQVDFEGVQGSELGALLTELHIVAGNGGTDQSRAALAALPEVCFVASRLAALLGDHGLAVHAIRRGWDAAQRVERADLSGLMAMGRALSLNRVGARRRSLSVLDEALSEIAEQPGPSLNDTRVPEAHGMLHLAAAQIAARDNRVGDADTHLDEASALARFTGDRNFLCYHFGPTNVASWRLAIAVETEQGPAAADTLDTKHVDFSTLGSADRSASVHFDLARLYAQGHGDRDQEAVRHLDIADRFAPLRVRQDPIARELVIGIDRRAKRRAWELNSLKNRLGVA